MPEIESSLTAILTIAIPTFDRHERLASTINQLIPQLSPACKLLIIDNASDPPVADGLGRILAAQLPSQTEIVRNSVNIGANANILRCLENCRTDWLWILSDDDRIAPDAVSAILEAIASHSDCICINFAEESKPRTESVVVSGRTELLEVVGRYFDTLLFLSTSVYKAKSVLPGITFGYMQIPACAPHLAVLLMTVNEYEKVYFPQRGIVEYLVAQRGSGWSQFWVERGFPLLLDLPLSAHDRKLLRAALHSRMGFRGLIVAYIDVIGYGVRTKELAVCRELFRLYALRRMSVTRSFIEWCIIQCLQMTLLFPALAIFALKTAFRFSRGQTLEERAAFVGLTLDERV